MKGTLLRGGEHSRGKAKPGSIQKPSTRTLRAGRSFKKRAYAEHIPATSWAFRTILKAMFDSFVRCFSQACGSLLGSCSSPWADLSRGHDLRLDATARLLLRSSERMLRQMTDAGRLVLYQRPFRRGKGPAYGHGLERAAESAGSVNRSVILGTKLPFRPTLTKHRHSFPSCQ
jgi:hypothetical protein